jgi:hypothetical protein
MSDEYPHMTALGDQIQAVCEASGLKVVGFTFFVDAGDGEGATVESRVRTDRLDYVKALQRYAEKELAEGDVGWSPA